MATEHEVKQLMQEMANFVAMYEVFEEKLIAREMVIAEKLHASGTAFAQQLASVNELLNNFQEVMSETGAARWRLAAETAAKDGRTHINELQQASTKIAAALQEGCERFQQTAQQTSHELVTAATQATPMGEFKQTIHTIIERIAELIRWFHWKNFAMILALTLLVVLLTGLYDNDEWPWELHNKAVKERTAGKALIAAWPHLTPQEQQAILQASNKKNIIS